MHSKISIYLKRSPSVDDYLRKNCYNNPFYFDITSMFENFL